MRKYYVSDLKINTPQPPLPQSYTCLSGNIQMPELTSMSVDCTIEIIEMMSSENISTIEDFESFLRDSPYDWATSEMMEKALREVYPERFL